MCWGLRTQGLRLELFQKVTELRQLPAQRGRCADAGGRVGRLPRQASVGDSASRWGNLAGSSDLTPGIAVSGGT